MNGLKGYQCETCGTFHAFSIYQIAHQAEDMKHECYECGAIHQLRNLVPRQIKSGTLRTPPPQLTEWHMHGFLIDAPAPVRDGLYQLLYMTGVESDRYWYWRCDRQMFLSHPEAETGIRLGSIKGWRGQDREA